MSNHTTPAGTSSTGGYDRSEINTRKLLLWAIACLVFVIASIVFVVQYFDIVKDETIYNQVLKPESVPLRDLHAHEDQVLNSYKVLDPAKGVYQIPIDRAIQLVADEAYQGKQRP